MKKIIYLVPIIAIAIAILWASGRSLVPTVVEEEREESQEENKPLIESPILPDQTLPLENDPKTLAWNLFQKYLSYNKSQNLDGVKSVVYKISKMCDTAVLTQEGKNRMSSAYVYGSALKKEDFKNIWSDKSQIILTTDFWVEDSDDMSLMGRFRSIIFFVRDSGGEFKLLSFSPTKGSATGKGEASDEELKARIIRWTEDNDMDGKADYEEECLHKPNDIGCVKTDLQMRDTDGDGWWDGVETLF